MGQTRPVLPLQKARASAPAIAWRAQDVPQPEFTGLRVEEDVPLSEIVPFIDWTFFFTAWQLKGRFPAILLKSGGATSARP